MRHDHAHIFCGSGFGSNKIVNFRIVLIPSLLAIVLTGCSSIRAYPKRVVDEKTELKYLAHYFTDDVIQVYDSKPDDERRSYRDEVVNGRLRAIDLEFEIFQKEINTERNLSQIGTDWAVLGLSGAGTIAGGATTKAILAAISGGLTGAKLSFDKTLYYEKTMPVLLAQMEASRARQLVNIWIGLQQDPLQYPLTQALVDVDNYYKVGTLPGAIIAISNSAGATTDQAQTQLGQLLQGTYLKDKAGEALRKFWKPDGTTINAANEQKLKAWLSKNGFDPGAITLFLRSKEDADARVKAVNDLGLNN